MIYCFKITLRPQGCAGIEVWNFESYASNYYDALNRDASLLYSYRNGKKLVEGSASEAKIVL